MDGKVLDSWALLAWLRGEPSAQVIDALFSRAESGDLALHCSAINAGEVFYQLLRARRVDEAERFWSGLARGEAPVRLEMVTVPRVRSAALVKATYPLAYADAFAIALAREFGFPLVTGDPEMRAPADDRVITVEWLARG